jgi:single-strand DNA-binding protein
MINIVHLLGRVGKKDTKQAKDNSLVLNLAIATTKEKIDSNGAKQNQTTWHTVTCFKKLAEITADYVNVGDLIYVTGELNVYTSPDNKRFVSVNAQDIKFISKAQDKGQPTKQESTPQLDYKFNDDLPF